MWWSTDTAQTYGTDTSTRVSWLSPWVTARLPSARLAVAAGPTRLLQPFSSVPSLQDDSFSPLSWARPPTIHPPDTFVPSGMASELPDVGGKTIGLNQPTSPYVSRPWEEFISERQEGASISGRTIGGDLPASVGLVRTFLVDRKQ